MVFISDYHKYKISHKSLLKSMLEQIYKELLKEVAGSMHVNVKRNNIGFLNGFSESINKF